MMGDDVGDAWESYGSVTVQLLLDSTKKKDRCE